MSARHQEPQGGGAKDTDFKEKGVSVVLPALNEAESVSGTIADIHKTLGSQHDWDFEIILVDDGSSDETGQRADDLGVRVIRHPQTMGYGRALKTGIEAAKHEVIAIADPDGTYPIHMLPELLARYAEGFHMVVGQRTGAVYRENIIKSPLRYILKLLVEFTAGRKIPDVNSGLRVFDKKLAQRFFPNLCDTFSFTTSLTLSFMMNSLFVAYVPIEYYKRVNKTKVRLFNDSLRTFLYIVQSALYYSPLKIFILLASVIALFAIAGIGLTAVTGVRGPYYLGVGGLLTAVIVFCMGLLADLLKQILDRH